MDILLLIKYILLGLVQGFTEPLPISSSGHLVIFEELFNIRTADLNFEIFVNAGSLIAIVFFYRNFLLELIKKSFSFVFKKQQEYKKDFYYVLFLIVGVIPAGLVGYFFKNYIESALKNIIVVGFSLLITSIALNLVAKKAQNEDLKEDINLEDAGTIGLFQVFALIPGISRSGVTMVGGLSRNIKFEETMRFSFLLYIPISLGALLLGILDFRAETVFVPGYIAGFIVSLFSTYVAIQVLFRMVKQGNLKYFSMYCMIVGFLVLVANYVFGVM